MKKTMTYRFLHEDGVPLTVEYTVTPDIVQGVVVNTDKQKAKQRPERRTRTQNMNYAAHIASIHSGDNK